MKISVKLLRVYTKWSLVCKHICAGGGSVTFVVLRTFGARILLCPPSGLEGGPSGLNWLFNLILTAVKMQKQTIVKSC